MVIKNLLVVWFMFMLVGQLKQEPKEIKGVIYERECMLIENNDDFYTCEDQGVETYFKCDDLEGDEFDACTDQA